LGDASGDDESEFYCSGGSALDCVLPVSALGQHDEREESYGSDVIFSFYTSLGGRLSSFWFNLRKTWSISIHPSVVLNKFF
jgi:hypothetical protein